MRNYLTNTINEICCARPKASDLDQGWEDAELGVKFNETKSEDWKLGWRAYHAVYGQRFFGNYYRH